jgi:hypothetical protein
MIRKAFDECLLRSRRSHDCALAKGKQLPRFADGHRTAVWLVLASIRSHNSSAIRPNGLALYCHTNILQFTVPTRTPGQHTQTVRPDGYFRLTVPDSLPLEFFLEVDRSTEVLRILVEKARGYRAFYRTGGFARRCCGSPIDFHKYPFRVLMVFMTAERRNNVAELLLYDRPPIRSQVLLSTFAEAISDPFGPIWITPEAYRSALGSDMPTVPHAKRRPYRRPAARDDLVEARVEKLSILPRRPPPPPGSTQSGS